MSTDQSSPNLPWWLRGLLLLSLCAVFYLRVSEGCEVFLLGHMYEHVQNLRQQIEGDSPVLNPEIFKTGLYLGGPPLYYWLHEPARLFRDPVHGIYALYAIYQAIGLIAIVAASRARVFPEVAMWTAALIIAGTLGAKGVLLENSVLANTMNLLGFGLLVLAMGSRAWAMWFLTGLVLGATSVVHIGYLSGLLAALVAALFLPRPRWRAVLALVAGASIFLGGALVGISVGEPWREIPVGNVQVPPPVDPLSSEPLMEIIPGIFLLQWPVVLGLLIALFGLYRSLRQRRQSTNVESESRPARWPMLLTWIGSAFLCSLCALIFSLSRLDTNLGELMSLLEKITLIAEPASAMVMALVIWHLIEALFRRPGLHALTPHPLKLQVLLLLLFYVGWNGVRASFPDVLSWRGPYTCRTCLAGIDEAHDYRKHDFIPFPTALARIGPLLEAKLDENELVTGEVHGFDPMAEALILWDQPDDESSRPTEGAARGTLAIPKAAELDILTLAGSVDLGSWAAVPGCSFLHARACEAPNQTPEVCVTLPEEAFEGGTLLVALGPRYLTFVGAAAEFDPIETYDAVLTWPRLPVSGEICSWFIVDLARLDAPRATRSLRITEVPPPPLVHDGWSTREVLTDQDLLDLCYLPAR